MERSVLDSFLTQHFFRASLLKKSNQNENKNLPIDIQYSDERVLFARHSQGLVDPVDDAVKEVGIKMFGQRIAGIDGTLPWLRFDYRLRSQNNTPMTQPATHVFCPDSQQLTENSQVKIRRLGMKRENISAAMRSI